MDGSAASSAIRKLDEFYTGLAPDERKIIGLIVSSSVQRAARAEAESDWFQDGKLLLEFLTPDHAPTLVTELGTYVPGQAAPMKAEKRPPT
jgi:hypothetical protein